MRNTANGPVLEPSDTVDSVPWWTELQGMWGAHQPTNYQVVNATVTVTATAWAEVPSVPVAYINLNAPFGYNFPAGAWVELLVRFGGWNVTSTGGETRYGVRVVDGAGTWTPITWTGDAYSKPDLPGDSWADTIKAPAGTSGLSFNHTRIIRMPINKVGMLTAVQLMGYKSVSGATSTIGYPMVSVSILKVGMP